MGECVIYPAPYAGDPPGGFAGGCPAPCGATPCAGSPARPDPPGVTWADLEYDWPNGCQRELHICWSATFDREPTTLDEISGGLCGGVNTCDMVGGGCGTAVVMPASFGGGIFPTHTASWGPTNPWKGYGPTKYEILLNGSVAATLNGHVTFPGGVKQGPVWVEPDTCYTFGAGFVPDTGVPFTIAVRVTWSDVQRWTMWCYDNTVVSGGPGLGCSHAHSTCSQDLTEAACQYIGYPFSLGLRSGAAFGPGYGSVTPGVCGPFPAQCGTCFECCACCDCVPPNPDTVRCGIQLPSDWGRFDFEKIDHVLTSPDTTIQCPKPWCEDYEDCGSAGPPTGTTQVGTSSCAETGFYCSPTHVGDYPLDGENYWLRDAVSSFAPVYLSAVLWLPSSPTLPPSFSRDVLVLAAVGDLASSPAFYFEGMAIRVTSDAASNPSIYAVGAYGRAGASWNAFGTPTPLCLGEGNCLQFRYWAGDASLPPSPSLYPVGTAISNGVEVGREAHARSPSATPFTEAVAFGSVLSSTGSFAGLVDDAWLDDVCYTQAAWITPACCCNPPTGNVYLSRAVAPEAKDPAWSPPSAAGVVNLRGTSSGAEGGGTPAGGPSLGAGEVDLGGARVKID